MDINEQKVNPSTVVEERLEMAKQNSKIEKIQEINEAKTLDLGATLAQILQDD